jgi:hypothetical protein
MQHVPLSSVDGLIQGGDVCYEAFDGEVSILARVVF